MLLLVLLLHTVCYFIYCLGSKGKRTAAELPESCIPAREGRSTKRGLWRHEAVRRGKPRHSDEKRGYLHGCWWICGGKARGCYDAPESSPVAQCIYPLIIFFWRAETSGC